MLQSGALGAGLRIPTSDSVLLPMIGVSCIDIDVPGDGTNVRGVYLDWLVGRNIAQPLSADLRDIMPEPFSTSAPLQAPEVDEETFGTVTATLCCGDDPDRTDHGRSAAFHSQWSRSRWSRSVTSRSQVRGSIRRQKFM